MIFEVVSVNYGSSTSDIYSFRMNFRDMGSVFRAMSQCKALLIPLLIGTLRISKNILHILMSSMFNVFMWFALHAKITIICESYSIRNFA